MTGCELVKGATRRGIVLAVAGGGRHLRIRAPKGMVTPELRAELTQHKMAVLAWLCKRREGACFACKSTHFWLSVHGSLVCGVCHPPADPSLVSEWIEA